MTLLVVCFALMLGIVMASPTFAVYAAGEDGTAPTIVKTGGIDVDRKNHMGTLPNALKGVEYKAKDGSNYKIEATGTEPFTFRANKSGEGYAPLPEGLSLNPTTGEIVGTPTGDAGKYNISVTVTNKYGSDNISVGMYVYGETSKPKITTTQADIAVGYVDSSYSQRIVYNSGIGEPSEASITNGNLPKGLILRQAGFGNIYPQIIPVELFQKVGARLEKNRYGKRSFEATYLLKFKAKCGYCGMPMYSETGTASNGETNRYYKCAGKKKYHNGCTKSQVRKEYLEDIVVNAIIDELNRPGAIEFITKKLLETQEENIKNNSTVNALTKEKTKIDKQLENIANAIQNGIVSKTTAKRLQDLEEQQEKLEREILIEQSKQATPLTRAQIKEFYSDALEMEPRMLIEYLVKEVIMYDDKIQIIFKSPINTVLDEDRGFLLSANFCKPKKVISSRSSTKRKIIVEIRVE